MRSLSLRLPPDSDIRSTIEQLGREQNEEGFILGVVGNLSRAAFQCPGRAEPTVLEGNLEIITLNGTLSPSGVHLHLSLSDGDRSESSDGLSHRCPLSLGGLFGRPEVKVRHGLRPACRSGWPPP